MSLYRRIILWLFMGRCNYCNRLAEGMTVHRWWSVATTRVCPKCNADSHGGYDPRPTTITPVKPIGSLSDGTTEFLRRMAADNYGNHRG